MNTSLSGTIGRRWSIRAVQLDLARQMETIDTIKDFINFAKEWGYNTIFLYLEGVVRTESFPYRPKELSYSQDDIKLIVRMATDLGLEVIPCVATLGHAEHFLDCPELSHLEERDSPYKSMMCPSCEDTYQFLEKYLREIAALFPSKHFHIGCDESWGLGSCPACRERQRNGESPEDFLVAHVLRIHKFLSNQGKRTWIWDDMLENDIERAASLLPRDVVLCSWHYWTDHIDRNGFKGHFNNLRRHNPLPLYKKLGFDAVICPWVKGYHNPLRLTEISREHDVYGGIQTLWELFHSFVPGTLPTIAITGTFWSNLDECPQNVVESALKRLFPEADEELLLSVRGAITERFWHPESAQKLLRGLITQEELRILDSLQLYSLVLQRNLQNRADSRTCGILRELQAITRLQILIGTQRRVLPHLVDPRLSSDHRAAYTRQAKKCADDLAQLAKERATDWLTLRKGISPDRVSSLLEQLHRDLINFIEKWQATPTDKHALLNLTLTLPEAFSAPQLTIDIHQNDEWVSVYNGCNRPTNLRDSLYTIQVPIEVNTAMPDRIRLSASRFGSQGISYLSLIRRDITFSPVAVADIKGHVSRPTALLKDDAFATYLGYPDTALTLSHGRGDDTSSIEVILGPHKE